MTKRVYSHFLTRTQAIITAEVRGRGSLFISDPKDDHKPEQERAYCEVQCTMEGEDDEEEDEEEDKEDE
jgi:hypothetical protein